MERRVRAVARPTSSSAAHNAVAVDNFLQTLPPERSFSAAPAVHTAPRSAPVSRIVSSAKPSRGAIVTETVKKAAYALSDSCLHLEHLVLDAVDCQSVPLSGRTDTSISSRRCVGVCCLSPCCRLTPPRVSTSAPPSGFFFTGVPGLEEPTSIPLISPAYGARSSSAAAIIPRSQSQPMSPSSPDTILLVRPLCTPVCPAPATLTHPFQPKQDEPAVPSNLIQDMQNLEDADLWCFSQCGTNAPCRS